MSADKSVGKIDSGHSPQGERGQEYLAAVGATSPPAGSHGRDEEG